MSPVPHGQMSAAIAGRWCVVATLVGLSLVAAACAGGEARSTPAVTGGADSESAIERDDRPATAGDETSVAPLLDGDASVVTDADATPGEKFLSVSVGDILVCGLAVGGKVRCSYGDTPSGEFVAVSVGGKIFSEFDGFACGVRVNGDLECWGKIPEGVHRYREGTFATVSASDGYVCAVGGDGEVVCWGDDSLGQASSPPGEFTAVSAAPFRACGVRLDRTLACWEWDYDADGASVGTTPGGQFESVDAGALGACGIRVGGALICWEDDTYGQLSPPGGTFVSVDVGYFFSCGVRTDGTVACWGLREPSECVEHGLCWGWDAFPGFAPEGPFTAIGVASKLHAEWARQICGLRVGGEIVCWNTGAEVFRPPVGGFVALDSGGERMCGVRVGGAGECWGIAPEWGDVGVPVEWASARGEFVSVSAGGGHACGSRPSGEVACWGADLYGETRAPPGVFGEVSAGERFSCGLRPEGTVECWGANHWWQASPPLGRFMTVAAGDGFACGLRRGRAVQCWGRPPEGEPPVGFFESLSLKGHACAIGPGGVFDCWDGGEALETGHPGGAFVAVSAWGEEACGLRADGSVACWDGVSPDGSFEAISVRRGFACGVRSGGELDC